MTYRFVFNGDIADNETRSGVAQKLAKKFQISLNEITPLFEGSAIFERCSLNQATAQAYDKAFRETGAVGQVISEIEQNQSALKQTAPKQTSLKQTNLKQTTSEQATLEPAISNDDIHAQGKQASENSTHTAAKAAQEKPNDSSKTFSNENQWQNNKEQQQAEKWMRYSAILIAVIFILDKYLMKLHFIASDSFIAGIDFGYTPYIIGHIFLIIACVKYAEQKGYSWKVGLLGLASLAGLAILLILPNQNHGSEHTKLSRQQRLFSIGCIFIATVWLVGFLNQRQEIEDLYTEAQNLAQGRAQYPSTSLDIDPAIYEREQEELHTFVNRGFTLISERSLRPSQITEILDVLFMQMANYEIWLNYQTYLHFHQDTSTPEPLIPKNRRSHAWAMGKNIDDFLEQNPNMRLREGVNTWVHSRQSKANTFFENFNRDVRAFYEEFNRQKNRRKRNEDFDIQKLTINTQYNTKVSVAVDNEKYTVTYSAKIGILAKYPLVFGIYDRPTSKQSVWLPYNTTATPIAPFPMRYLSSPHNVLREYVHYE